MDYSYGFDDEKVDLDLHNFSVFAFAIVPKRFLIKMPLFIQITLSFYIPIA